MLGGKIVVKDKQLGDVIFDVKARDTFNELKIYTEVAPLDTQFTFTMVAAGDSVADGLKERVALTDATREALRTISLVDRTEENPDGLEKLAEYLSVQNWNMRRLDVKKTSKYKSNIENRDMCVKISSLIRYMQISGAKNNRPQSMGAEFTGKNTVIVEHPMTGEYIGTIAYNMGLITDLECENEFVKVVLHPVDDLKVEDSIFKDLKEKNKFGNIISATKVAIVGFKLTKEVLGFDYIPAVEKETVQAFGMFETIEEVIANNPDKNTDWILDRKYHIVSDETLEQVIAEFMAWNGPISFDTETSGLRMNFKSRTNEADQLVGCVLSKVTGEGYYFPLQHKLFQNLCGGDHHYFMDKYMRPILEGKPIICHNIKFDWKVAYIYDINVNCVYDTMLALGVTKRYEEETYELGLKALTKNIFGLDMFELSDFVIGGSFGDSEIAFWDLPYELVRRYAPADTDMTLSLYEFLEKEDIINKYNAKAVFQMEITFAKAVAYSEFYGYHIDVDKIPELHEKIVGAMEEQKGKMFEIAGKEFNPNSPAQLAKIMYDELGIELIGAKRSTDKETLKALSQKENPDGSPKYPFVKAIKTYRDNESIYKNFLKRLSEFATVDGYIFPDTLQLGTNTGRVSVKNPNYQGYNDIVKHYVVARPGFMHVDSDFAQIEYRVLCSMAKQEQLITAFNDPDLDYHTYQASRMFSLPYASVTKALRQQSKGVNFGLPYGMGDSSLGARIFGERNKVNTAKAAELRKKFFQGQEKIEKFFEDTRAGGIKNGFTETDFGRRRYYHRGVFSVEEIRRQAGNHVIQGTAADIYKLAVVQMFNTVCEEGWLGKVLFDGFIHDELLMEVHESINPYYFTKKWRDAFEVKIEGYCRLYAGLGYGKHWYEAKKLDLPPQYISDIIDKYHEDMPWNDDLEAFNKEVRVEYEVYKTNRIKTFITDKVNQGEVIKPVIGSLLAEELEKIGEKIQESGKVAEYNAILDGSAIPEKGKVFLKPLQDQLRVFCKYYDLDYSTINIKAPDEVVIKEDVKVEESRFTEEESPEEIAETEYRLRIVNLITRGYYISQIERTIYVAEVMLGSQTITRKLIDLGIAVQGTNGYKLVYYPTIKVPEPQCAEVQGYRVTETQLLADMYAFWVNKGGTIC